MSHTKHQKLGQFLATAICGNDILSSVLYVAGIAALFAGVYAPLVLLLVTMVLFFYRAVYREVVEAMPINGGAYNCLLNATSKPFAAIAGVMTILSYMATAVISAKVGVEYLHTVLPIPVIPVTIGLLFAFALLVISGVKDSARVAFVFFGIHILSIFSLIVLGIVYYLQSGPGIFFDSIVATQEIVARHGGLLPALYLAFSASLLGVSGFESSANFVEEQAPGVFRQTLRNMWVGVTIINPLVALVALTALPLSAILGSKDFLLSSVAQTIGGAWFQYVIVVDAFLVLSGAVLTAYVGVSGLAYRMTLDECLPGWLMKKKVGGSQPKIILSFFLLCASILLLTGGELLSLAGVYTISFLGVMSMFALGNLVLRETREDLKRPYQAPIVFVLLAFGATAAGLLGNIFIDPRNLRFFGIYFLPAMFVVFLMMYRHRILAVLLPLTRPILPLERWFSHTFRDVIKGRFVVFLHNPDRLFEFLRYIENNESGRHVIVIHCVSGTPHEGDSPCHEVAEVLSYMRKASIYPQLKIEFQCKHKAFGPAVVAEVEKEFHIKRSRMMVGAIHESHGFDYADLGGVRIVTS